MTQPTAVHIAAPVAQKERITILDSLRGIAILGILLMNIPAFSYPIGEDPSVYNETGVNYYTWYIVSLIPHGTQRALFSMLFGAGIILFLRNQQKRLDGLQPADYFFRRQLWLIVFSLFDVFILLWHGDILLDYAILGMITFPFRNLSSKKLMIAASVCLLFMLLRENRVLYQDKLTIKKGENIAAIDTSVTKLTALQKDDLQAMETFRSRNNPENKLKRANKQIEKTTGSYSTIYEDRTNKYVQGLVNYLYFGIWDVLVFMLLGMAFFKSGLLLGQARTSVYWLMCIIGLGLGIFLSWLYLKQLTQFNFNQFEYTKHIPIFFYELTRILRAIGLLGLIMLLYKSGWFKWFFNLLRPVGQMAFTNYLLQSLICAIIFYGIGFGLFGKLQRYEIYLVLGAIWLFQIIISHIWLRHFNFGPFEWLWRTLTYWKKQPFRKTSS